MGRPTSHSRFPSSQQRAPSASVSVNNSRCRRKNATETAANTALPIATRIGAAANGAPRIPAVAPRPVSSGPKYPHRRASATARSRLITVPKKPHAMSGPCSTTSSATGGGNGQPRRASPAATPRNNDTNASTSKGTRHATVTSALIPIAAPLAAAISGGLGDTHFPHLGAGLQVVPGERVAAFSLEMVIERFRIVVIDQQEGVPRSEFVERAKNQRMTLARNDGAHVEGGGRIGSHDFGLHWSLKKTSVHAEASAGPAEGLPCALRHPVRRPRRFPHQRDFDCHAFRQRGTNGPVRVLGNEVSHRAGRRGHGEFDADQFRRDVDAVNQSEIDDIHSDLGIVHRAKRFAYPLLGWQYSRLRFHVSSLKRYTICSFTIIHISGLSL